MRLLLLIIIPCLLAVVGCSEFPNTFENVQTNEYRVIDFMYEPAEAAPGDTVHMKALFAGKKIRISDVEWKISWNVVSNKYGIIDTAYDLRLLGTPVETAFSDNTTCMEMSFVIPKDIMYTSGSIPENWISLIPADYQSAIPAEYRGLTKKVMLDTIGKLMMIPPGIMNVMAATQPELKKMVPLMCQFLTVKSRIFAQIKGDYLIKSDYSVRYNSKFSAVPNLGVPVNKNPLIDSIGIYKVPGDIDEYNPAEKRHTFYRLDVLPGQEKTILLEKDYSYFVEVFTNKPDSTRTLGDIIEGTSHIENYYVKWFYQMDSAQMTGVNYNDYMNIGGDSARVVLIPPLDKKISNFTIWAQVYDQMTNEVMRPVGSMVCEGRGLFEYTDGYLSQKK